MSYHQEQDELVIDGFDKGIGDSPYSGLTDERCVNIVSVPGEASVSFATTQESFTPDTATFTVTNSGGDILVTPTGGHFGANANQAVTVSNSGGALPTNLAASTTYYILSNGATFKLSLTAGGTPRAYVDAGTGTQTMTSIDMGNPTHGCYEDLGSGSANYYVIDANGRAWARSASLGSGQWVFLNNTTLTAANGNGIIAWHGYLLVFRSGNIDYSPTASLATGTWTYGWKTPATTGNGTNHDAIIGWSNDVVYFCDGQYVSSLLEVSGQTFDPTNAATYTYSTKALTLTKNEIAQCLAMLGNNLMVGGAHNLIYPWDRTSTGYGTPIPVAENNIVKIITVNTNTYILAGNRGRVYITNGSQATLFKKIPDHLTGTVEPTYTWQAIGSQRNQLYVGVSATLNGGSALANNNQLGGLWAIDLDTKAIRRVNKLSYATYLGYVGVIISSITTQSGYGLFLGWNSGASTYGMDFGTSSPYTGGQATVVSDLIPVGTFLRKRTFEAIEYKLSMPLVSGESVQLLMGSTLNDYLNGTMTSIGTDSYISPGQISGYFTPKVQNQQWMILQAVLTSTATTPSFCRLEQMRIRGTTQQVIGAPAPL